MMNCYFLKNLLIHSSKKLQREARKATALPNRGFTLTELLVSVIIGVLILTGILGVLNDLIRASREEEVRTETQRDIKQALAFIENELKSAVYIYTGEDLSTSNRGAAPLTNFLDINSNYKVVLAFWKPEVIPYTPAGADVPLVCSTGSPPTISSDLDADATITECEEIQVERRTYTLVVYVQDTNPSSTWEGKTVIRRYAMRKYEDATYTDSLEDINGNGILDAGEDINGNGVLDSEKYLTLKRSENSSNQNIYIDPTKEASGFRKWPIAPDGTTNLQAETGYGKPQINGNTSPVLVDFVDDHTAHLGNLPTCLDEDTNNDGILQISEDNPSNGGNGNRVLDVYVPTPLNTSSTPPVPDSTSFFACVRQSFLQGDVSEGNQDVILYLRGNPDGRSGFKVNPNSYRPLPTLQSRVLLRGVVDKLFNQ